MYWRTLLLAGTVTLGAGYSTYKYQANKEKEIPIAYSEISQMEDNARELGIKIPAIYSSSAKTNDLVMKVFEASNESWNVATGVFSNQTEAFISELNKKVDPIYKEHRYEIPHLVRALNNELDSSIVELKDFKKLSNNLSHIISLLDKSWDDSHHDEYHTEIYYETVYETDSEGNTTSHEEMRTRSVYDYTDNSYTYNKQYGESASAKMDSAKAWFSDIRLDNNPVLPKEVGKKNVDAMERSRKKMLDGKKLNEKETLQFASNWYYGSTIYNNSLQAYLVWDQVKSSADEWRHAKRNGKNHFIRTYNYSHAEPYEFEVVETAIQRSKNLKYLLDNSTGAITGTKTKINELYSSIRKIIENQNNDQFDKKKEKKHILSLSKEIYKMNFNKGFDVDPAEYGWVALFSILGLMAGGGAGYLLDSRAEGRERSGFYY